jgi:NAD(P)-dependent dehydrogenase (short-subunit alcohol dehydrogenase family)
VVQTIRVNLLGPFFMCKHVLPHMVAAGHGPIINMTSISGLIAEPGLTAYGMSKGGVVQLTRSVASQYGKAGIRCNAVAPSIVLTRNMREYGLEWFPDAYLRHTMTPWVSEPDDVANVVVFLASDQARSMTGHVLRVDGGMTAEPSGSTATMVSGVSSVCAVGVTCSAAERVPT